MANPKENYWHVCGKGYYISLVTDKQGDVQLGVESKYGDYCSVKMSKEEMITNLRDLANQVEGWLQQEATLER